MKDRWPVVKALFRRVAEGSAQEREELLDAADPAIRKEVEALLEADRRPPGFLDRPIARLNCEDGGGHPLVGARLGAYRLLELIGRGGMGEVFLAVRDDATFEQRVAVKVLRDAAASREQVARFRTERQILAALTHTNIAHLLDGGSTEDGRPYLVMEYVEGVPIDAYCDHHRLGLGERIELFRQVCSAVDHAHRNLLVHRDIKPGNVLVTDDAVPKLLDFGIAKPLDPGAFPTTVEATRTRHQLLTPAYASPEQVAGEPITTASDVYSLGVLLYKLLSGHLPYPNARPGSASTTVYDEDPQRPSTAVDRKVKTMEDRGEVPRPTPEQIAEDRGLRPAQLRRQLTGDLDHILLTALRRDPQRRYGSVERFADDLRRHLAGLPVWAQGDSLAYRLRKLVRRHRATTAVAITLLASLTAFAVTAAWQATRIAQERDAARLDRDRAEQVATLFEEMFELSDPSTALGETITAREILDRGAERLRRELADQPELRGALLTTVGGVYLKLGLYDRAKGILEEGLAARREALGEHPDVAQTVLRLADVELLRGDYDAAESRVEEALALTDGVEGAGSTAFEGVRILAGSARGRGDYVRSLALYRRALELSRRLFDGDSMAASTLSDIGVLVHDQGDYDSAAGYYRQALEIQRRILPPADPRLVTTLSNLATVEADLGDLESAEERLTEVLRIREKVLGPEHPFIAITLHNLATVQQGRGDLAAAEAGFRRVLELRLRILGEDHPMTAHSVHTLGVLLRSRGDPEAEPTLVRALALERNAMGDRHPLVAYTLLALGQLYLEGGQPGRAEPLFREGHSIWSEALPPEDWRTAVASGRIGASLLRQGRLDDAEPLLRAARAALADRPGQAAEEAERVAGWIVELGERRRAAGGEMQTTSPPTQR